MKQIRLGRSDLEVSNIALGCMRMAALSVDEACDVIQASLDNGFNFFDHADIYGRGTSEEIFGQAIKKLEIAREDIIIQTKCGIRDGLFDFSKEHILESVENSLKRLQTDYIDVLLLHRPDALFEPEEVNEAFKILKENNKVRWFGVSNQNPMQIELLQKSLEVPLIANQVQFSLKHTAMLDFGFNVNMNDNPGLNRDGGIIEHARLHDMTLQAWSPFYSGFFEEVFVDSDNFKELNDVMAEIGASFNVSKEAIAVAWILRHPASFQVVIGSMNPKRIARIAQGSEIVLTREMWYRLYRTAGNRLP